jgi:hypothetical protein
MITVLGNTRAVEIPTDSDLGDAIATLVRFIDVHNTMSHPASYSLVYDNSTGRWLSEQQEHQGSTRRQLSAHGTLAGHTQVEVWTHVAETHNS